MKKIQVKILDKIKETNRSVTLILEVLDGEQIYEAGQFLTFIFNNLGPKEIRRSYSFSSAPEVDKHWAITVKKQVNGLASKYLTETVQLGEVLTALAPAGQFTMPLNQEARDIFLIGGGSGITPLFSILKNVLYHEPQSKVTLINANSRLSSVIFQKQLQQLSAQFPQQFQTIHLLSHLSDQAHFYDQKLPNVEVLNQRLGNILVEDLIIKHLKHPRQNAQFFLCGPKNLMLKSRMVLGFMGFTKEQVHQEIFVIREPMRPDAAQLPNSEITITYRQKKHKFPLVAGQTILGAAEQAGVELPYSCLSGTCTTCAGHCASGQVDMYTQEGLLNTQTTKGLVMTCVGYPSTEKVKIML